MSPVSAIPSAWMVSSEPSRVNVAPRSDGCNVIRNDPAEPAMIGRWNRRFFIAVTGAFAATLVASRASSMMAEAGRMDLSFRRWSRHQGALTSRLRANAISPNRDTLSESNGCGRACRMGRLVAAWAGRMGRVWKR